MAFETLQYINRTGAESYLFQGPGVGAGAHALTYLEEHTPYRITPKHRVLEVGFGEGELLEALAQRGLPLHHILGVDIAVASLNAAHKRLQVDNDGTGYLFVRDASHDDLPFPDDWVDAAFCTETIEHLSNPYFMVAEVKRVLQHGGIFVIAHPMPESNLGYGSGKHAHVYPGFLLKDSFEMFLRQMFFKIDHSWENGDSRWVVCRNYKGPGIVDPFEVISGNYDEAALYAPLDSF